jgi:hypothetical protein
MGVEEGGGEGFEGVIKEEGVRKRERVEAWVRVSEEPLAEVMVQLWLLVRESTDAGVLVRGSL